ncbi:MAG: glycosyltransferase family 4 protein [Rhodobacteraceae bacterium]|nr:glycosyltransferase family 4 protein [Paracoccaceae bacterium]
MTPLPRVLILADSCNPEWPSLPVVGYKYARALSQVADVTIITHIRNRENIEKAGELANKFHYINNEWIAGPMHRLAIFLRGGNEVAWSTNQMMSYPPYIDFERQVLANFRSQLDNGDFDLVHRITPMSPTLPSYISGRTRQPFLIGPLNGNLDWPTAFSREQKREREGLRRLRGAYRYLPFARSTYRNAACIMAAFQHTIDGLSGVDPQKIVPFPEIGFDPQVFHAKGRNTPFSKDGPKRFLFAGRLVPYKVPEAAVRAFATSKILKNHILHILGDGPEQARLEHIVAEAGEGDRIIFEGPKSQSEVAEFMRRCDAFVFPSIRELGAGVVIEAMASGIVCLVTNYGAPGDLTAGGRGVQIALQPMEGLVRDYKAAMESCIADPSAYAAMALTAQKYAQTYYDWDAKAAYTADLYRAVLNGQDMGKFSEYK